MAAPKYPTVTQVRILDDYVLQLAFDNGEQGKLDMSPYLDFGVFRRLRNPEQFRQVKIAFHTLGWSCGVDLDPEFVYEKAVRSVAVG